AVLSLVRPAPIGPREGSRTRRSGCVGLGVEGRKSNNYDMMLAIRFEIRQGSKGIQGRHLGKCCREIQVWSGNLRFSAGATVSFEMIQKTFKSTAICTFLQFIGVGFLSAQSLSLGPVVGGVTSSTANVFVRTDNSARVQIRYGADPTLQTYS